MGVSPAGASLACAGAFLCAVAAIYWPSKTAAAAPLTTCPLGFNSECNARPNKSLASALPDGHPPVLTSTRTDAATRVKIFTNASIWTADPEVPWADTMAVKEGRLVAVGTAADVLALHGIGSDVVDLQGRFVTPGLVDAHVHLVPGGLALMHVDLGSVRSRDAFVAAVMEAAEVATPGQWIVGGGWNEMLWGGGTPAAAWLDAVTPDAPVYLTRMDGHSALANSAALRAAGIDDYTPDPAGGRIIRDAAGAATGMLAESAINLVTAHIPVKSLLDRRAALDRAAQHLLSRGITTVCDMGRPPFTGRAESAWEDLEELIVPAAEARQLPIRVVSYMPLSTWNQTADLVRRQGGRSHASGRVHWGHVKAFHDGSLGSRTALMHEPYSDEPDNAGMRVVPLKELRSMAAAADAAELNLAIHAIGDRAVDEVLDILRGVAANNSGRVAERRHRVEHAQHLAGPQVAAEFAALGAVAVTNPLHLLDDRAAMLQRLGAARSAAGHAFAFRTLQQAGAPQAFGSDWPVVPLDALGGIYAAAHRRAAGSDDPSFEPAERLTLKDALRLHTADAARSAFLEKEVGSLRPGLRADFTLYSDSILESGEHMPHVLHTYLDGDLVWSSDESI